MASDRELPADVSLEDLLANASEGDPLSIRAFLRLFLSSPVLVPDRFQGRPLQNEPKYPSELFALMGVTDGERAIIPCFSDHQALLHWSGSPLQHSTVRGSDLLSRVPDDWWVVLNPGSEIAKDFSPWEIANLKQGPEAIEAILHDLAQDQPTTSISVEPLTLDPSDPLYRTAQTYASTNSGILELYLATERSRGSEGEEFECILVGILCSDTKSIEYQAELQAQLDHLRIGDNPVRVIASPMRDSLQFSIFEKLSAVWKRPSLIEKLLSKFR